MSHLAHGVMWNRIVWQVVLIPLDHLYTRFIFTLGVSVMVLVATALCFPAARIEDNYLALASQAPISLCHSSFKRREWSGGYFCVGRCAFLTLTCQKATCLRHSCSMCSHLHVLSWHSHTITTAFPVWCTSRPRAYNLHANRLGCTYLLHAFCGATLCGAARGVASHRGLRSFPMVEFAVESNLSSESIAHRHNA